MGTGDSLPRHPVAVPIEAFRWRQRRTCVVTHDRKDLHSREPEETRVGCKISGSAMADENDGIRVRVLGKPGTPLELKTKHAESWEAFKDWHS